MDSMGSFYFCNYSNCYDRSCWSRCQKTMALGAVFFMDHCDPLDSNVADSTPARRMHNYGSMSRVPSAISQRRRVPKPDRRRALELLAASRDGCTEAILFAHGLSVIQMVDLVREGLATAHSRRVIVGKRVIEIAHLKITEAGRQALADQPTRRHDSSAAARGARAPSPICLKPRRLCEQPRPPVIRRGEFHWAR